jgi:hypothetical protein
MQKSIPVWRMAELQVSPSIPTQAEAQDCSPDALELVSLNGTSHAQYSSNWAGAVLIGTGYTSVTGVSPSIPTQAEAQDCSPDEASEGSFGLGTVNSPVIGTGYTSVTGEFTVPKPKLPSDASSGEQSCASA